MKQKQPTAVAHSTDTNDKHPAEYNHQFDKEVLSSLNAQLAVIDETGTIVSVNKAWDDFAKINESTPLSTAVEGMNFFSICSNAEREGHLISGQVAEGIEALFNKEKHFFELDYGCQFATGIRWFTFYAASFEKDPSKIVITHQDISARKLAEKKILHANRLYTFISQVNQTIVHTSDEQKLFEKICSIAIEFGKFSSTWIALADKEKHTLNLKASCGISGSASFLHTNFNYLPGTAIDKVLQGLEYFVDVDPKNDGQPTVFNTILSANTHSGICLPVKKGGNIIGVFIICSAEPDFFTTEEIKLLKEAAFDVSFALDVFEKEKQKLAAEDKLRISQLQLIQAEAIAHFGSWEFNFTTDTGTWSDEALKIYGFTHTNNQLSYESWLSAIHPEDLALVMKATGEGEENSGSSAFFYRIIRPDGTVKHLYCQAKFQFDSSGRTVGLHGVDHDVSDVNEAAESLLISQSNLIAIIENTDAAVYSLDTNFNYTAFNKLYQDTLKKNYGINIQAGDKAYGLSLETDKTEIDITENQYKQVLLGETIKFEKESNIDGLQSFNSISLHPIWKNKKVVGLSCFKTDITKQKQEEFQKEKITADLLLRNKDLEQFSYIISHNLRAPVANIMSLVTLMNSDELFNEDKKMLLNGLTTSIGKLDEVIRDLNYILQVRAQASEQKTIVQFSELVQNIEVSIRYLLEEQHTVIQTDFSQAGELLTVKSFLQSIFFNLISNSIKYRRNDVQLSIEIESRLANNNIELYFRDNGLGIDLTKKTNQVFGLYKRFHTDKAEGKGIGLYMVKTQVEAIGGIISISSEVNKGTEFKIVFNGS